MPASIEKVSSGGSATTNKNATTNNTNTKTEVKTETIPILCPKKRIYGR